MKDPYVLENGTLKNSLGIDNYDLLTKAEKDISYVKLIDIEELAEDECNADLLKKVHKHVFGDLYEWAGNFREVPIYKTELVIPGISLEYAPYKQIDKRLEKIFEDTKDIKWNENNIDEVTKEFTELLAKIWRVHPFRDGNTRTTLAFANIYAKQHGFELDMIQMLDELGRIQDPETGKIVRWGLRDKFVLAALDEEHYPEPQALEQVIKKAILNGGKFKNNIEKNEEER